MIKHQVRNTSYSHGNVSEISETGASLLVRGFFVLLLSCLTVFHATASNGVINVGKNWPGVGGDGNNQRYSPLAQINSKNIDKLGGAWVRELDVKTRTAPIMVDEILYTNDASKIYALDAKTGETIWVYTPDQSTPARGGVTVADGKVFGSLVDAHLVALDPKSGKLLWKSYVGNVIQDKDDAGDEMSFGADIPSFDPKAGFLSSAPNYINGKVVVGLSGGDAGTRSKIAAVDANTGKLAWEWWVAPNPGEPGSETWPEGIASSLLGGGAVWRHGAGDPDLGLIYFGTGNGWPIVGGELRAGDNLYMASLVALDVNTGKLKWHQQLTHHDLWEMDLSTPPILYETKVKEQTRKAVAIMRTDGFLFVFDRATGEPLVPVEERPVKQDIRQHTAATQPFPVGVEQVGPNCVEQEFMVHGYEPGCWFDPPFYDKPNVIIQNPNVRFPPMSYSPQTGYFYVSGGIAPWIHRRIVNPNIYLWGRPPGAKEAGLVAAIDSRTMKIVWQNRSPWSLVSGSGLMTTAGGLMFRTEGDGNVLAFDAKTGKQLWSFQTGVLAGPTIGTLTSGAPLTSYEVDGEQFIVAPNGNTLWAFKLNGSLAQRPAPPVPPTEYGFQGLVKALGPNDEIGLAVTQLSQGAGAGPEYYVDEYSFTPNRARVRRGHSVKFTNYGVETHTVAADDGSWTSGPIAPGQSASITITKPGKYTYYSTEFPWSKGQLVVQ